jgi:hypothetical protein
LKKFPAIHAVCLSRGELVKFKQRRRIAPAHQIKFILGDAYRGILSRSGDSTSSGHPVPHFVRGTPVAHGNGIKTAGMRPSPRNLHAHLPENCERTSERMQWIARSEKTPVYTCLARQNDFQTYVNADGLDTLNRALPSICPPPILWDWDAY